MPRNKSAQFILLRGLARESRHWGDFPERLRKEILRHATVTPEKLSIDCLDLPGTGRFSEMRSPISIEEIAEFVRTKFYELKAGRRQRGLEADAPVYLIAISLGGMVAADWLRHWPDEFAGCVLINTSFRGYSGLTKRLRLVNWIPLARAINERDAVHRESRILRLVSNRAAKYGSTAKEWAKIAHSRPISRENFGRQLLAAMRFSVKLETPPVPMLLISSAADRFVDSSCTRAIAERWNAPVISHPDAGHDLSLDEPDWLAHEIGQWWTALNG